MENLPGSVAITSFQDKHGESEGELGHVLKGNKATFAVLINSFKMKSLILLSSSLDWT